MIRDTRLLYGKCIYISLLLVGLTGTPLPGFGKSMGNTMTSLVIDLQAGYSEDEVSIQINGEKKYHNKAVSTDYSIGLADSVELDVIVGSVTVKLSVPSRKLSESIELDVSKPVYLGVSISGNRVETRISDEMFVYF